MIVSAFEHPFLSGLLGDEEVTKLMSPQAEIDAMLAFEAALAKAQADEGLIPAEAADQIVNSVTSFTPDIEALREATGRDGVVVPDLVRQLRTAVGGGAALHLHFGVTSQDVIDTALMLRLKTVSSLLQRRLAQLESRLAELDRLFGSRRLMGYTRMQAAIPVTVSDRIRAWQEPLARHRQRLEAFERHGFVLQFGGAAGTLDKLGDKAASVRAALAWALDLSDAPQWQSQRDRLAEFAGILSLITGSLGKFGQDIALLAQAGSEIKLAGGGGSSAMAHKQNPVAAEVLVALARYNAVQLSGMQQAVVHEQERSGAAWTLEWLILPPMVQATGASSRLGVELAANIISLGEDAARGTDDPRNT
ncbi:3-carboxy-cis,cis-muconate cycloisomerase [Neorhizobium lilium]|uniref:3-carboxy-cis,cis-muconate cycloisomerase n=1 Tax=Neorhizobium lilium TaxID=2503024 RepID=A0A444LKW3_9HYPH|nr:3-carboxy-cis,cis-muconate cycloisomerase [Neorhizobium lilium]RWX80930.1 3-carboxy-cis,cis-muconate cycloisomerase [Neorhizobium lilium]